MCVKQFLQLNKNNNEKYHIINSLNEWCEQAVLEPSVEMNYSFLIAYKYAKTIINGRKEVFEYACARA